MLLLSTHEVVATETSNKRAAGRYDREEGGCGGVGGNGGLELVLGGQGGAGGHAHQLGEARGQGTPTLAHGGHRYQRPGKVKGCILALLNPRKLSSKFSCRFKQCYSRESTVLQYRRKWSCSGQENKCKA